MDDITIINSIREGVINHKSEIIVSSKATKATKAAATRATKSAAADIQINNFLDILLKSMSIKENQSLYRKEQLVFNLQRLNKVFVKGFIYRMLQGLYVFTKYQRIKKKHSGILFYAPQLSKADIDSLYSILYYSNISRNIVNEPANIFTPERMADYACKMFRDSKYVKINNYNHKDIKRMGLRLIDAVGGSSRNKPHFVVFDYKPPKYKKTICLVGKGVTIDTGGYSMKSGKGMEQMYMDKEGASLSFGLFKYIVDSKSNQCKHRVVCLCPLVENIVTDNSMKPNDVIKAYNGTTVEIVNTDAEGRLILADALAFACKNYNPDYLFDYATLTGWSERLHCHTSFTYFTLNETFAKDIERYNREYAEKSIRLPPWVEYIYYIQSNIADVKNSGYKCNSGGLMASMFLMNFIPPKYRKNWIHFDVRLSSYNNTVNIADGFATYLEIIKGI
jgi:leucyl aminopeptidase